MKIHAPKSHPRYLSNLYRDILAHGVRKGITSLQGLTAHGRGEAFDYLLGEQTNSFARHAIDASAALLLTAKSPVVSVNGNTAALVPRELVTLSRILSCPLEINLFHASKTREQKIAKHLMYFGARNILFPDTTRIPGIESNRSMISRKGQKIADVIFIPLEDGDRTEALLALRKQVITVDANPLSRTARFATITIVDTITRALPLLLAILERLKQASPSTLHAIVRAYDNKLTRAASLRFLAKRLTTLANL